MICSSPTLPTRTIAEDCLSTLALNPNYNLMALKKKASARSKVEKLFTSANSRLDLSDGPDYMPTHSLHLGDTTW